MKRKNMRKELLKKKSVKIISVLFLSIYMFCPNYARSATKGHTSPKNQTKTVSYPKKAGQTLIGKLAPNFILNSITGEKYNLSSTKGKVVLIDFWHTY